jgi:hypothetical protein
MQNLTKEEHRLNRIREMGAKIFIKLVTQSNWGIINHEAAAKRAKEAAEAFYKQQP